MTRRRRKTAFDSWWSGSGRVASRKPNCRLMPGSRMWRPALRFASGSLTTPRSGPSSNNAILPSWTAIQRHAIRFAAPHAMAGSPSSTVRMTRNTTTPLHLRNTWMPKWARKGPLIMPQAEPSRGDARTPEPTEGPFLTFDLAEQIAHLRQESYWQSGRNSKTIVKYSDFRVVLTAIQAKTTIHEHHAAGRISVHTVQGHLRMHAGGKEFDLP